MRQRTGLDGKLHYMQPISETLFFAAQNGRTLTTQLWALWLIHVAEMNEQEVQSVPVMCARRCLI